MKTFAGVRLAPDTRSAIDALFRAVGLPEVRDLPGAAGDSASRFIDGGYLLEAIDYRRTFTESRIQTAVSFLRDPPPRPPGFIVLVKNTLRLSASVIPGQEGASKVQVTTAFNPMRVTLAKQDDHHIASLDLAVFVDDANQELVGETMQRIDLKLSAQDYARIKREWMEFDITVDAKGQPAQVLAVLYDYGTDRSATAKARLRPQK